MAAVVGVVMEALPSALYKVRLDEGSLVTAEEEPVDTAAAPRAAAGGTSCILMSLGATRAVRGSLPST